MAAAVRANERNARVLPMRNRAPSRECGEHSRWLAYGDCIDGWSHIESEGTQASMCVMFPAAATKQGAREYLAWWIEKHPRGNHETDAVRDALSQKGQPSRGGRAPLSERPGLDAGPQGDAPWFPLGLRSARALAVFGLIQGPGDIGRSAITVVSRSRERTQLSAVASTAPTSLSARRISAARSRRWIGS